MDPKQQHTYVLYTLKEGVFYVGIGDDRRLKETVKPRKTHYSFSYSTKRQEIERRQADGQEILLEVVFSSEQRSEVEQCERGLIACYGPLLSNFIYTDTTRASSWLPIGMKHQKFPIEDCSECMRLARKKFDATREWTRAKGILSTYPPSAAPAGIEETYRLAQVEYYHHVQTHPQIVPK
jgi:hypothetical protein